MFFLTAPNSKRSQVSRAPTNISIDTVIKGKPPSLLHSTPSTSFSQGAKSGSDKIFSGSDNLTSIAYSPRSQSLHYTDMLNSRSGGRTASGVIKSALSLWVRCRKPKRNNEQNRWGGFWGRLYKDLMSYQII